MLLTFVRIGKADIFECERRSSLIVFEKDVCDGFTKSVYKRIREKFGEEKYHFDKIIFYKKSHIITFKNYLR